MSNYLEHHGILGMHWGVRRYQNADGSYTPEGLARLQKKNFRTVKKHMKGPYSPIEKKRAITDLVKKSKNPQIKQDLKDTQEKFDTWKKYIKSHDNGDFTDSKEYEDLQKRAFKETYKSFEKDYPNELKEMLRKANGDMGLLGEFHDFRKMNEGTEDMLWDEYENKWKKNNPQQSLSNKKADQLWDDYWKSTEKIAKDLIGEYADVKVNELSKYNTSTYGQEFLWNVNMDELIDKHH